MQGNTLKHIVHGKGPSTVHDARLYGLYEQQSGKPLDIRLKDPYPSRTLFGAICAGRIIKGERSNETLLSCYGRLSGIIFNCC
jgi:hypothetical protein